MTIEDFKQRVATARSSLELEMLARSWFEFRATPEERAELRRLWIQRWDDISSRRVLEIAGQLT